MLSFPPVEVFAPARADLAGGTLDLWPLWCLHPQSLTLNVSLAVGVRLVLEPYPDAWVMHEVHGVRQELAPNDAAHDLTAAVVGHFLPCGGVRVRVLEQLPVGSGLGGSSVYAVALARACLAVSRQKLSRRRLVATLRDLEAMVLQAPTGTQDYYPALLPGVLAIHHRPGGEVVERIAVRKRWLGAHLLVIFTGITHHSGLVNWQVYRARVDGDPTVSRWLDAIAVAARQCRQALMSRDATAVGEAIAREWEARRQLAPDVAPPELAAVLGAGVAAGAWAGKACGAGGGGSVLFWTPPQRRNAVAKAALACCQEGFTVPLLAS